MSGIRTPLARVRGLGSAKEGVQHWWLQRLTGLALVPLSLWFVYAMAGLTGVQFQVFREWMRHTHNTILLSLLVAFSFYHAQLGLQVVIEDYVHHEGTKLTSLVAIKFLAFVLAASAIYEVLRVGIGGQ
jgi:succinate dehydrogenase / fumarate reductase membrane anchor subunit